MDQLNPGSTEYTELQKALARRWASEAAAEGIKFIAVRLIGFSRDLDRSARLCTVDGINVVLNLMTFPTGPAGWQIVIEDATDKLASLFDEEA